MIPKEARPKKKRKIMSWRDRKAKWLAKTRKDELKKSRDNTNKETSTSIEGGLVLVAKVFKPLDSIL